MDRSKFIQSSTRLRVMEKELLKSENFIRASETETLEDALRSLSDTVYNKYINKISSPTEYEYILKEEITRFYDELFDISPSKIPIRLITLKYFYHNLKVIIKEDIGKKDLKDLYMNIGDFDLKEYRDALVKGNKRNKNIELIQRVEEIYEEKKDPQLIDIYLDNAYFTELLELAEESQVDLFIEYAKNLIDFTNIRTLLRAKKQEKDVEFLRQIIIEGGNVRKETYLDLLNREVSSDTDVFKKLEIYKYIKEALDSFKERGNLSDFEREMDNYFIDLIKDVKYITYGPEVIFANVLAKEMEIKNLRIILVSKLNGLDSEFIREKLRDTYV
ncbi:MAG: V-type ATP synthase subunit C [Peptoniphilus grossensis]|uniref:V-type ATP synthase subunit C n=1 Tax=Peptoniphilus grossensis TaxID=1465756 RepID=UPI00290E0CFE|nr:V-type ATP synthase subunit C [Peptoniphilus grossensis]MDU7151997.1 V-type ATP synthase subunit C [Peptoniphilus grossensis]